MIQFSVVIAVYNKQDEIADTLKSVLDQDYPHFEIVIVNDGSTDKSEKVIKEFNDDRIRYFKQVNQGPSAARNFGIKESTHNRIALLDADDYWYTNHLSSLVELINKYPKEFVFANGVEVLRSGKIFSCSYSISEKNEISIQNYFRGSLQTSLLNSSNCVIYKEVFEKIGYYNEQYTSGEDTDLYVRLGQHFNVVFNPKITSRYQMSSSGLHLSSKNFNKKATFNEYIPKEVKNQDLKRFLDLNRFSLAILAKITGNKTAFVKMYEAIDLKNLNRKQQFLLKSPSLLIRGTQKLKLLLESKGIYLSTFK